MDKPFWLVDNGVIYCNCLVSKGYVCSWLMSDKEFGDFELRLKFRASTLRKGIVGVLIRSRYYGNDVVEGDISSWLDGPQVDIEPANP